MQERIFRMSWLIIVILLISQAKWSSGGKWETQRTASGEVVVAWSPGELGEEDEVSIEAVEQGDGGGSRWLPPSVSFSRWKNTEEETTVEKSSTASAQSIASETDSSTAVATVYQEYGGSSNGTNGTSLNGTSATGNRFLRVKVACASFFSENETISEEGMAVEIVNMTHLLHGILYTNPTIKTRSTPSNCSVVMFYTHWCPWSAKAAPHFNALPRAFKNIRFAAIDCSVYSAVNTYFGILSVPSVVLFYNGKILAKFNETTFTVNQFAEFISTFTDQKPGIRLNVTSQDFVGPLPSVHTKGPDLYLYLAWAFIIACFIYYMSKTAIWHRMLELVQNSWREAEAVSSVPPHHYHQD